MRYFGRILGVVASICSGCGFWITGLGFLIGYIIDQLLDIDVSNSDNFFEQKNRKYTFIYITFQVMGHLNKSKGRITEKDIIHANKLMLQMRLNDSLRQLAQKAFREGKEKNFPLRDQLHNLHKVFCSRSDLIQMFLDIQIQAAFSDNVLHPNEREILYIIVEELGIDHNNLNKFFNTQKRNNRSSYTKESYWDDRYQQNKNNAKHSSLEEACKILDVKLYDDVSTIKKAYRKMMNEYHPDKLIAKKLPADMLEIAKKKTQEIQKAYNILKQEKRF